MANNLFIYVIFFVYFISASFTLHISTVPVLKETGRRENKSEIFNASVQDVPVNNTVAIRVYYETLCPASVDFFLFQLAPAVEALASRLNVLLIPYGHALTRQVRGSYTFRCQHGPAECYGNKLHACSLDVIRNNTKAVLFNTCLMQYSLGGGSDVDFSPALNWCGYIMNVDIRRVWHCANTRWGSYLLKSFGAETQSIDPRYVPYVILDGSSDPQDQATGNLMTTLCQKLQPMPPVCEEYIRDQRRF